MTSLLRVLIDILLLRRGPQALPAAPALAGLCAAAYALSGFVSLLGSGPSLQVVLAQTVLDLMLLTAFTHLLLLAFGKSARFLQTWTALTGTGTLFALMVIPLTWLFAQNGGTDVAPIGSYLYLGLVLWSIAVMAQVLMHALSTSRLIAIGWSLGYFTLSVVAMTFLFPLVG